MTHQEILTKAIEKAITGGYKEKYISVSDDGDGLMYQLGSPVKDLDNEVYYGHEREVESLIFNHDFAKALWGESGYKEAGESASLITTIPAWEWHIQQMVIADDPIAYLGEHLEG